MMSLSNSKILLSENDLNTMEFSFLLRSTFQTDQYHHPYLNVNSQDDHETKLSLSTSDKDMIVDDDDNGFKTPTTLDHKIPTSLRCPMAPRKPKSRPVMKRKAYRRQRLLRDLSYEIQSLFPTDFIVGLGGKIKRVRQEREIS